MRYFQGLLAGLVVAALAVVVTHRLMLHPSSPHPFHGETIYIVNHDPQDFSDAAIWADIPAWEKAANQDFAPVWHTPQVRLELVKKAPKGAIVAQFIQQGPVQGALAYHSVSHGVPRITVYAGTARYYGFSVSVAFTHELFEELADPSISVTNQGYPYPTVTVNGVTELQTPGTVWAQEVCDPVESVRDGYKIDGVRISDFITPNWFNNKVSGGYDFTGAATLPFDVLMGGYAQYWDGSSWNVVQGFAHIPGADGFLKGETR